MPTQTATQIGDAPVRFTACLAGADKPFAGGMDAVKFVVRTAADGKDWVAAVAGLELQDADGNPIFAALDGLELAGSGSTPAAAQNALIRVMRGWLERQDTAGILAESLGMEHVDEETDIILQLADPTDASLPRAALLPGHASPGAYGVSDSSWDIDRPVSVWTYRG